jgi:hypothetical protein
MAKLNDVTTPPDAAPTTMGDDGSEPTVTGAADANGTTPGARAVFPTSSAARNDSTMDDPPGGSVEFVLGGNILEPPPTMVADDGDGVRIPCDVAHVEDAYAVEIEDAAVELMSSSNVMSAEPVKTMRFMGREIDSSNVKWATCLSVIAAVAVVLAVSVPTAMHYHRKGSAEEASVEGMKESEQKREELVQSLGQFGEFTVEERAEELRSRLASISNDEELNDPSTPQGMAFNLMISDGNSRIDSKMYHPSIPISKAQERYSLLVFYFSTGGDEWTRTDDFLTIGNHCDWSDMIECVGEFESSDGQNNCITGPASCVFQERVVGLYFGKSRPW